MWLCVTFISIKPLCGCCCSLTQTSSHIEITQREQVNQRSLNTCKSFLWSFLLLSLCLVLLWPVQSRLASGQLVCSGHILIQMKSGRSKELLYGAWAPGPRPQLLSQLHNYSAECEYSFSYIIIASLMFVLLPKGVYIWGWGAHSGTWGSIYWQKTMQHGLRICLLRALHQCVIVSTKSHNNSTLCHRILAHYYCKSSLCPWDVVCRNMRKKTMA